MGHLFGLFWATFAVKTRSFRTKSKTWFELEREARFIWNNVSECLLYALLLHCFHAIVLVSFAVALLPSNWLRKLCCCTALMWLALLALLLHCSHNRLEMSAQRFGRTVPLNSGRIFGESLEHRRRILQGTARLRLGGAGSASRGALVEQQKSSKRAAGEQHQSSKRTANEQQESSKRAAKEQQESRKRTAKK